MEPHCCRLVSNFTAFLPFISPPSSETSILNLIPLFRTMENRTAFLNLNTFHQTRNSSHPSYPSLQPFQNSSTSSSSLRSPPPAELVITPNVPYMPAELVIAFLSTIGNLVVCAAVGLNSQSRNITSYFLVSLAVAWHLCWRDCHPLCHPYWYCFAESQSLPVSVF